MKSRSRVSARPPPPAFFFSSRRRHTTCLSDWSSDVCSSDLAIKREVALVPFSCSMPPQDALTQRSEEHTSELQSLRHLVCRLLLEKKNELKNRKVLLRVGYE